MDLPKSDSAIFRQYYIEYDFLLSAEGILKSLSVIACVATSAASLARGACAARAAAGGVALGGGALLALLGAGAALALPARLYTELVLSSALGALLLAGGALGPALCDAQGLIDHIQTLVAIATGCLVIGSAYKTYAAVLTRLETRPPSSTELEV